MPKPYNVKSMQKLFEAHGWTRSSGGKHSVKMIKPGHRPVTLPTHKRRDYGPGLAASILRQGGIE